ncbi:cytochrome b [Halovulum sp. GXIMD14794]
MSFRDGRDGWGWPTRAVHWSMAALILGMLGLGFWMSRVEQDLLLQFDLIQRHKSFGTMVFALACLRIAWRASQRARPSDPVEMPSWQRQAARLSHLALYALMLALPLSGWLMASASPLNDADALPFQIPNMVFGLFELPDPFPKGSEALAARLRRLHGILALGLALLLGLHVAAALKHHFADRDPVLRRMLRGR